jgi:pyrroloquinoline quinone (PQQ) biosynthesis protein C
MNLSKSLMKPFCLTALLVALPVHAQENAKARPSQAQRLVEELRSDLAPVENQIRNHPYLTALEAGQMPLSNLRAFAGEQYHIIKSDLRSAAQLVARFGGIPAGDFFQGIQEGEILARGFLLRFAAALGMTEAELQAYEPNPLAQTYPSYVTWLSVHASDAQVATSYVVNFAVFGENVGRMGVALRNRYGFSAEDTAYFDFFSVLPPDFEPTALAVIDASLDCADVREIKRSARLLQAYELDFWDAVAEN